MRVFVNLFLVLFLADGTISLMDELLRASLHVGLLALPRNSVAFFTIFISVVLYIALGIDRRLPKRILLFPLLYVFWGTTGLWPLSAVVGRSISGVLAAFGQIALGTAVMLYMRKLNTVSLLMTEAMLSPPVFSLRNTLLFFTLNILFLPPALFLFGFAGTNSYIQKKTAGFVKLGLDGLYMKEKVYRRDDKTILLTSMIHIADKSYYDSLLSSLALDRTIVLMEGVSDKNNLLTNKFTYQKLADVLGLVSQERTTFKGKFIEKQAFLELHGAPDEDQAPYLIRADIDISQFKPQTVAFLNALGKYLFGSESLSTGAKLYSQWAKKNLSGGAMQTILNDILDKRNREVIRYMKKALLKYDTIVIPWGALHMPGIEAAVKDEGFQLEKVTQRRSIDFRKIHYKRIIEKLRQLISETGDRAFPWRAAASAGSAGSLRPEKCPPLNNTFA